MHNSRILVAIALGALLVDGGRAAEFSADEGRAALRKAVGFFVDNAAKQGGYVWRYCDNSEFRASKTKKNRTNITTLDDDTAQAAL